MISKASVQHVAVGHVAGEWTDIRAPGLDLLGELTFIKAINRHEVSAPSEV